MKLSKTQKGIGIAAVVALVGWFAWDGYRKRWQPFDKDANTRWGEFGSATEHPSKLAIKPVNPNHGIAAGDTIEVNFSKRYPSKEYKVLETLEGVEDGNWIVLDHTANDGPDVAGSFRLVKKA